MASDPANVSTAEEDIVVVNVEDVFSRGCGADEISTCGVHDTLGLAGRSRRVQQEQRVFGAHGLWGNVVGVFFHLLVPPPVAAFGPRDVGAGALVDQAVRDAGALLQGIVDNLLGADGLAATLALVGGDDDL